GLAAGHRPCAQCRRERFDAFRKAWAAGGDVTAAAIDERLHAERLRADGTKRTFVGDPEGLPDGGFVTPGGSAEASLLGGGRLLAWSPGGYRSPRPRPDGGRVAVLTPPSTVAAIRAGYVPAVHASAGGHRGDPPA